MKTLYTIALISAALSSQAQTTISTTSNFTFVPEAVTIQLGGSVSFAVGDIHTATQVSEATWLANGTTPLPGGFDLGPGTHLYTPSEAGTIYFVCQPHASMGMKGQIVVETTIGLEENTTMGHFRLFPNPATDELTIEMDDVPLELVLIDIQGRKVMNITVHLNDRISVAHLPEGNYTAILHNSEGRSIGTQRLTIAR